MRRTEGAVSAIIAALAASGGSANPPSRSVSIAAEPLGRAVLEIGARFGLNVGLGPGVSPDLPAGAVAGVTGARGALERSTRGLPVVVVEIDATTFRIDPRPATRHALRPPAPRAGTPARPDGEIIVTADKRGSLLSRLPATLARIGGASLSPADAAAGSDAIVRTLPSVGSTELGAGRNKLFLRGVADSSFNGLSQSTTGQYFGEARLTYNAPDPDLLLTDLSFVEVLEGPQGTLYGAGALGGVIRVVPNPVRLDRLEGSLSAGLSLTAHGAFGDDASGMLNLPLVSERVGARLVVYRSVEGGYIDDAERGLTNVNRTVVRGGRLTIVGKLGGDWSVEGGAIFQDIDAADGQYAERGEPPLTRRNAIAQPFDNDYRLGDVVLRGPLGGAALVSTTSAVGHVVDSIYDFTADPDSPRAFGDNNSISLLAHETRLTRDFESGGGWLAGVSLLRERDKLIRTLGDPARPTRITGVRNVTYEGALYGELTVPFRDRLQGTVGVRASLDRLSGEGLDVAGIEQPGSHRTAARIVPLAALSWRPFADLTLFARYAEGYRPGGLSVAGESDLGTGTAAPERFRGDEIGTLEAGLRAGAPGGPVSGAFTLSYARWRHIQADLVSAAGFPYTANIGTGRILALEASIIMKPTSRLRLDASVTLQEDHLDKAELPIANAEDRDLPNVPTVGAQASANWRRPFAGGVALDLRAGVRFIGRSHLGAGDILNIPQGDYLDTRVGARLGTSRLGVTVDLSNLADVKGNRFAFGDPFDVAERNQVTPLRPRTIRLGVETRF